MFLWFYVLMLLVLLLVALGWILDLTFRLSVFEAVDKLKDEIIAKLRDDLNRAGGQG